MNFEQLVKSHLESKCIFFNQDVIIDYCKGHDLFQEMSGRWNEKTSLYPDVFSTIFIHSVNIVTLEWIKVNKPKAFYRPLFEETKEK